MYILQNKLKFKSKYIYILQIKSVLGNIQSRQREIVKAFLKDKMPGYSLEKQRNGAPVLTGEDKWFISISHSQDFVAISLSQTDSTGVDIQHHRDLLGKAEFYLSDSEIKSFGADRDKLLIAWCAKEAFFKYKNGKIESYLHDMIIDKIDSDRVYLTFQQKSIEMMVVRNLNYTIVAC